jgi:hypothetical protein
MHSGGSHCKFQRSAIIKNLALELRARKHLRKICTRRTVESFSSPSTTRTKSKDDGPALGRRAPCHERRHLTLS